MGKQHFLRGAAACDLLSLEMFTSLRPLTSFLFQSRDLFIVDIRGDQKKRYFPNFLTAPVFNTLTLRF